MRTFAHLAPKKPNAAEPEDGLRRFLADASTPTRDQRAQAAAAAIVKAGARRRGESVGFEHGPPQFKPITATAADIAKAVAKRDEGDDLLPPMTPAAQAIIDAGRKRRNES